MRLHKMKLYKFCTFNKEIDIKQASLINIIRSEIQEKGPITFPKFWHQALLHEKFGYYMKQDVFNKEGDFVTSVEISQMFNELIGIWLINTFQHIKVLDADFNQQKKMHILEFGPGLGTLSSNIMRVFAQLNQIHNIQYSYIEYSDFMRKKQQDSVLKELQKLGIYPKYQFNDQKIEKFESDEINLKWFKTYEQFLFEETGQGKHCDPIIILAHEFFDALPVNLFEFHKGQWCEKLVGLDEKDMKTLKFVLSNGPNQNVEKILNPNKYFSSDVKKLIKEGDTIEISPQSSVIVNSLAELISKVGGAALLIDYGEKRAFSDSIRAIQRHKLLDKNAILNKPGDCDLSAYVNFMALEQAALKVEGIKVPELMTQGTWLEQMGIQARLQILQKNSNKATEKRLQTEYERLVNSNQMGSNFKFMCIHRQTDYNLFPFIQDAQQIYY